MSEPRSGPPPDGGQGRPKPKKGTQRLDAFLARAGLASRREARGLIRRGEVRVDGEICRDPGRRIAREAVSLGGKGIESPSAQRDFLLHKPVGLACSHDERESPLVFDLLSERLRRRGLRIAGRLDRATSGLLILTSDGALVHRLTHPARKLPKRYRIELDGELAADAVRRCAEGLLLPGEERATRPAELQLDGPGRATLVLREGRTHQVRRMMRALGAEVVGLHRDRIGDLDLPEDLGPGELRPLEPEERALLLSERSL
ncbi:MAG: rRNA pseudouridine synthase [Deltaproteobacteria bacterium]|jgi:16S rRNA pseudouridine516 synthase|nr:rRNA pseudouridine synthase [Deltaproteobacteria bacterium]MBW2496389.1 rRNA pseudouridine synthase [Deltaproteobacteria bacterium]